MFALPVGARRKIGRFVLLGSWSRILRPVGRVVVGPWFALISFNVVMVVWHFPALFDLAENNQTVQHLAHARELLRHRRALLAPDSSPPIPSG